MNNDELLRKAETLASRKYLTIVRYEPEGEGAPDYVALHPEFPGCVAQGNTVREARASLDEATVFWIRCLLEDNLPVPDPMPFGGTVVEAVNEGRAHGNPSFEAMVRNLHLHRA